jgi:hypothetical protein
MRYYDLKRYWDRVGPHLGDKEVSAVLVRDFNKFTYGRWRMPFKKGMAPREFETCYWDDGHRGPEPRFWKYVKHAACHWLANFGLRLAERAAPKRAWRVLTSDLHSTVWDGKDVLFDFTYQAMGISARDCYRAASKGGQQLAPGELLEVGYARHYRLDTCFARARKASR